MKNTISFIEVKEIKDDVIVLKNGGLRAILMVSGVNFFLLAEREQKILIEQFSNFLNSLEFPLQILVMSRKVNLETYFKNLQERLAQEKEPLIKLQLEDYIEFLNSFLETHAVMRKLFFIVIPFDPLVPEKITGLKTIFRKPQEEERKSYQELLTQLETRVLYVKEALNGMGLNTVRLTTGELTQLLYENYNPSLQFGVAPEIIKSLKK